MDKNKLIIKSLRKLKITKVKPWAVYFTYNNQKYLLHGGETDYLDDTCNLFKRVWDYELNKYTLEFINGDYWHTSYIENDFIKYKGKGQVYNQINKEYFVNKLVKHKFAKSLIIKEQPMDKKFIQECKNVAEEFNSNTNEIVVNEEHIDSINGFSIKENNFNCNGIALEDLRNNSICRINEDNEISNTKRYEDFTSASRFVLVSNLPTINQSLDGNFIIRKGEMCRYSIIYIH